MRVVYWNTTCLQPEIEAVSREVRELADRFADSRVVAVSPHLSLIVRDGGRTLGFHPVWDPLLRLLFPLIERGADVNHVYGEPGPWVFYKTLKKKPTVLTVASEKGDLVLPFLARCGAVVAQTREFKRRLLQAGVAPEKVHLIYPGVDLEGFRPAPVPPSTDTPRVLFASAPRSAEEMAPRGVNLLLDWAARDPNSHLRLLYRAWAGGDTAYAPTRGRIDGEGLKNVELTHGAEAAMSALYPRFHFTVIPYTTADGGKECPNSLVEGLACGVPVLISRSAPFSGFVAEHKCGVVFEPTPEGLQKALEIGMENRRALSVAARETAESCFSRSWAMDAYAELYRTVA